jgi:protein-disulfide isomerase
VVALVVIVIATSLRPTGPGPAAMPDGGFVLTAETMPAPTDTAPPVPTDTATPVPTDTATPVPTDTATPEPSGAEPVPITVYLDYQCPTCRAFETTNGDYLAALVQSGAATLDIHPIAILDRVSQGTRYSTRTANLMACVADTAPERFWAVSRELFAQQPEEGTAGPDDEALLKLAEGVGVTGSDAFESCVRSETHSGWVAAQTKALRTSPVPGTDIMVTGTPTVIVDGVKYTGSFTDAQAFATFVVGQASRG